MPYERTPEIREKNRQGLLGRHDSAEVREQKRIAHLHLTQDQSTREKHRQNAIGNSYGFKHGYARGQTRTYNSWQHMRTRCSNPNSQSYPYYGGRGVTVCERWRNSFENFLADMGKRPEGMTLDRYPNPAGNYELSNCRWATAREQSLNQRRRKSRGQTA